MIKLIYVVSPYNAPDQRSSWRNITAAHEANFRISEIGTNPHNKYFAFPVSPCSNTAWAETQDIDNEYWYIGDLILLSYCDAAFFNKGWEKSSGCTSEFDFCIKHKIAILKSYFNVQDFLMGRLV